MKKEDINNITEDMCRAIQLPPYEAVDVYWVALVKFSLLMPGKSQHKRMIDLIENLSSESIEHIISNPKIDILLGLDPPLETVINSPHEKLYSEKTKLAINQFYQNKETNPKESLLVLGEILKRIRNKRAHGFKTSNGFRDQEILDSSKDILGRICGSVAEALLLKLEVSE